MIIQGDTPDASSAAVTGTNTDGGIGVFGNSISGLGVSGHSETSAAVAGESSVGSGVTAHAHGESPALESINDDSNDDAGPGIRARSVAAGIIGESTRWMGVFGITQSNTGGHGVMGQSVGTGAGVAGDSIHGPGILGQAAGISWASAGVQGIVTNTEGVGSGVLGENQGLGPGVAGLATHAEGVLGFHGDPRLQETTVRDDGGKAGVFGASDAGAGVVGYSRDPNSVGVLAFGGIRASAIDHPLAGEFFGNVEVHGDIFLPGADCAEQFDIDTDDDAEAGDVVVISPSGGMRRSSMSYDKRVAGVISGAGSCRPGIVLNGHRTTIRGTSIALVGRVFCKVDAQQRAVNVGDLLTSSDTPGHAMLAADRDRAFGSVLGKALGQLSAGTGLLPILVCLQ